MAEITVVVEKDKIGYDPVENVAKVGDGVTQWNNLEPFNKTEVTDSLTSTSTKSALSANQGKVLDTKIDNVNTRLSTTAASLDESIKALGDAFYAEGHIIEGCAISYDANTSTVNCDAGKIVMGGLIYSVPTTSITITTTDPVKVGIWRVINGEDGTTSAEWGLDIDDHTAEDAFYPMHGITNQEVVVNLQNDTNPEYATMIAQYDKDANGSYVSNGLNVSALSYDQNTNVEVFSISDGSAHIDGVIASLNYSKRLEVNADADIGRVSSEYHNYVVEGRTYGTDYQYDRSGSFTFTAKEGPITEITRVEVAKLASETYTYTYASNGINPLNNTSVFKILSVTSGSTTYTESNGDFTLTGNSIVWGSNHPADGATFNCTYIYTAALNTSELATVVKTIDNANKTTTITIPNVLENTYVAVDYRFKLARMDLIVMHSDNSISFINGVGHRYSPTLPATPPDSIALAKVVQNWYTLPEIESLAVAVVKMEDLKNMNNHIRNLYNITSQNELRFDALISAPASVSGVFVDPFNDDDMRDSGIEQNAIISDNLLQLPMDISHFTFNTNKEIALDSQAERLISQELHTKSMQVNPYQAFDPMPLKVTLSPSIDRVTTTVTTTGDYVYKYLTASQAYAKGYTKNQLWSYNGHKYTYSTDLVSQSSSTTTVGGVLRQLTITITCTGLNPNEEADIRFDNIFIKTVTADTGGKFTTTFQIPANIPDGTKLVQVIGKTYNKIGAAYYVGIHEKKTIVNYYYVYQLDPVAQSFTLNENRLVSAVQFFLSKKGTADLIVELRETVNGYPKAGEVLSSVRLPVMNLVNNAWNTATFDVPVFLNGGTEYCLTILTDTADHNVGISELGDYDSSSGWVRSQPYSAGVLFSSSNASTWTPHQSADMAFRIIGSLFTTTTKDVNLGSISLNNVSDILPMAEVATTSPNTNVEFVLKNASNNAEVGSAQAYQVMNFDEPLNGTYTLYARLSGETKYSPILGRDPQIVIGSIKSSGSYVSRSFACGSNKKVRVTVAEYIPTGATCNVSVLTGNNVYTDGTLVSSSFIGDGWYSNVYEVACNLDYTKVKIVLTGSSANRPFVGSLTAVILDA